MTTRTWKIIAVGFPLVAFFLSLSPYWLVFLAAILILGLLSKLAESSRAVRRLFEPRGPRTDTRYMTRDELFRSGRSFLIGATALIVVLAAVLTLLLPFPRLESAPVILVGIAWGLCLLTVGLLCGGLYLLVRGLFRSRNYDPFSVYLRDTLEQEDEEQSR